MRQSWVLRGVVLNMTLTMRVINFTHTPPRYNVINVSQRSLEVGPELIAWIYSSKILVLATLDFGTDP
jgi:hypothetical protein